jgi:hypothetical protein
VARAAVELVLAGEADGLEVGVGDLAEGGRLGWRRRGDGRRG